MIWWAIIRVIYKINVAFYITENVRRVIQPQQKRKAQTSFVSGDSGICNPNYVTGNCLLIGRV